MGCTVAPGFDFADFEKASIQDLKEYIDKYPDTIERLV
jgi:predicted cupin superfamily sugar epimerase